MAHRVEYHHCENCRDVMPFNKDVANHVLHLLVSIFTCGLWVIAWAIIALSSGEMRCGNCGNTLGAGKREGKKKRKQEAKEYIHEQLLEHGPPIGERVKVLRGEHKGKFGKVTAKDGQTITLSDKAGRTIQVQTYDIV